MSKASDVLEVLTSRPLSPKQIRERREAEGPRTKRVVTSAGQVVEEPLTPTQPRRVIKTLPTQITD
jgi:hypothetical protein